MRENTSYTFFKKNLKNQFKTCEADGNPLKVRDVRDIDPILMRSYPNENVFPV